MPHTCTRTALGQPSRRTRKATAVTATHLGRLVLISKHATVTNRCAKLAHVQLSGGGTVQRRHVLRVLPERPTLGVRDPPRDASHCAGPALVHGVGHVRGLGEQAARASAQVRGTAALVRRAGNTTRGARPCATGRTSVFRRRLEGNDPKSGDCAQEHASQSVRLDTLGPPAVRHTAKTLVGTTPCYVQVTPPPTTTTTTVNARGSTTATSCSRGACSYRRVATTTVDVERKESERISGRLAHLHARPRPVQATNRGTPGTTLLSESIHSHTVTKRAQSCKHCQWLRQKRNHTV